MSAELTITLPESQRAYIDGVVAAGKFSSPSELVATLVRDAQLQDERDRVDALIQEGLDSGPSSEMTAQDWNGIRTEVHHRLSARNGS